MPRKLGATPLDGEHAVVGLIGQAPPPLCLGLLWVTYKRALHTDISIRAQDLVERRPRPDLYRLISCRRRPGLMSTPLFVRKGDGVHGRQVGSRKDFPACRYLERTRP